MSDSPAATAASQSWVQPNQQVTLLFSAANRSTPAELDAWLNEVPLTNRVHRRTFTPFVGYGAVQSGPPTKDP